MAKLTANGVTIEGTAEELAVLMTQMAAKADVVEAEVVAEDEPLKVGDYARVVVQDTEFNGAYKVGDIVNIAKIDASEVPYEAGDLDGKETRWFKPEHLTKASDEEVAQAEAAAIERKKTAVFTDAGRKPNEYREGDIVKVIRRTTGHTVGTIGEIVRSVTDDYPFVKAKGEDGGVYGLYSYVEPLVFVENRLDRN